MKNLVKVKSYITINIKKQNCLRNNKSIWMKFRKKITKNSLKKRYLSKKQGKNTLNHYRYNINNKKSSYKWFKAVAKIEFLRQIICMFIKC